MSAPFEDKSTVLSKSEQDANIVGTYEARPGTTDIEPPASLPGSTLISKSEQDAKLSETYEARPGVTDSNPAGVSSTTDSNLSSAVKDKLDGLAGQGTSNKSITEQLPSTQSITQQLPSAQSITEQLPSAQQAADTLKSGASALIAGISSLAVGASNVTAQNASASHPESDTAKDVDDLHVPGAFESATDDRDDSAAVKNTAQSMYDSLPSTEQVKQSIPSTEQVKQSIPSTEQVKSQLPDLTSNSQTGSKPGSSYIQSAKDSIPSTEQVKSQVTSLGSTDQTTSSSGPSLTERAQDAAASLQSQAQQGAQYIQDQLSGQSKAVGQQPQVENSQVHKEGTDYIKDQVFGNGQDPTISSVGSGSSTSELAGQIPLEARNIPEVVRDSHRQAGEAAPLDLPGFNPAGKMSTTSEMAGQVPLEPRGVPEVVTESQREAGVAPEAASNPEAVQEKRELEQELKREVPPEPVTSDGGITQTVRETTSTVGSKVPTLGGAAASLGSIVPSVSGGDHGQSNSGITTSSGSGAVPEVVTESQREAGESPEAAANPEAVQEKSAVEQELKREVPPEPVTSDGGIIQSVRNATSTVGSKVPTTTSGGIGQTVFGATAALGSTAASAAQYAREKTHEVTGTDPVSILPESAQRTVEQNIGSTSASTPGNRPTGIGAAEDDLRDTIESSAGPDVSHENRPKTLPQSEIAVREQERGLGEGTSDSPYPRVAGISQPSDNSTSQGGIHNGVIGAGSQSSGNSISQGGIHNGVTGAGSSEPLATSHHGIESSLGQSSSDTVKTETVGVAPVPTAEAVDLSVGVKNTVTGAGSSEGI